MGGRRKEGKGKKRGKGEREGQVDPQVQKPGDNPTFNMQCCIPRLLLRADNHALHGDTKVYPYMSITLTTTLFDWNYCIGKYCHVFRHFSIQLRCISILYINTTWSREHAHSFKGPVRRSVLRSVHRSVRRTVRRTVRWCVRETVRRTVRRTLRRTIRRTRRRTADTSTDCPTDCPSDSPSDSPPV